MSPPYYAFGLLCRVRLKRRPSRIDQLLENELRLFLDTSAQKNIYEVSSRFVDILYFFCSLKSQNLVLKVGLVNRPTAGYSSVRGMCTLLSYENIKLLWIRWIQLVKQRYCLSNDCIFKRCRPVLLIWMLTFKPIYLYLKINNKPWIRIQFAFKKRFFYTDTVGKYAR